MESKPDIFSKKNLSERILIEDSSSHSLFNEINKRLTERLLLIKKKKFKAIELGSRTNTTLENLSKEKNIKNFFFSNISYPMLLKTKSKILINNSIKNKSFINLNEENIPFKEKIFDLVLSNLYLHWSNDIYKCLTEINRILKPDGLFLASLFGNETLKELKYSLYIAESKLTNKVVPSIPSFLNIQQTGSLLQNTGFNLPVVDKDIIKIFYKDIFDLMQDIKLMGGNNNFIGRKKISMSNKIFNMANKIYKKKFSKVNKIYATYEILYLIGWKKHSSQQKPKKPWSATRSLSEVLS